MFHPGWRAQSLARMGERFDLMVIGGGITGCGIALDAAQRGLRVLLVEKGDLGSGTSGRSSKLIHGGLRYLKRMQLNITRTASRERDRMLALDPHLVRPLRFLYPIRAGDPTPRWQVDLGLWVYDHLGTGSDPHVHLDPAEALALAPELDVKDSATVFAFNDGVTDDARLVWAVAATAHAHGVALLTRCAAHEPLRDAHGRVTGLVLEDLETGRRHDAQAALIVNATGVWTDEVRARLGLGGRRLRPSRGAHLVLAHEWAALDAALTMPAPRDARPVFLVPHPEGVLLGTTDIFHDGALEDPRPTPDEIAYLLEAAAAAFPGRQDPAGYVRGAFAGLRPILDSYADNPADASRDEEIWEEGGVLHVSGGKLTTWRSTAEEAVDRALERLPKDRRDRAGACATGGTALAGLAPVDLAQRLAAAHGLSAEVAAGLARRLASLSWPAVALARTPVETTPLCEGSDLCAAEVRAHLRWGAILHLDDSLLRRVRVGMWQPAAVPALLPALAPLLREELGWDAARLDREERALAAALRSWTPPAVATRAP